jgi:hypothetical protein
MSVPLPRIAPEILRCKAGDVAARKLVLTAVELAGTTSRDRRLGGPSFDRSERPAPVPAEAMRGANRRALTRLEEPLVSRSAGWRTTRLTGT